MSTEAASAAQPVGECDPAFDETEPEIQQGDVLALVAGSDDEPWANHFGLIITASCDLAQAKHGGILSYVPIVPLEVGTQHVLLPKALQVHAKAARDLLAERVPEEAPWPSLDRLAELCAIEKDAERIIAVLPDDPARELVSTAIRYAVSCNAGLPQLPSGFQESLKGLDEITRLGAQARQRKLKPHVPLDQVGKELKATLTKQLPGDCFFVSQIGRDHADGYLAYLRLIRELARDSISTSAVLDRKLGERARARRIGRLSTLYLHRIVQQMTKVFFDIGLPDEYEARQSVAVSHAVDRWAALVSEALSTTDPKEASK